jgi:predicted ester cyclase
MTVEAGDWVRRIVGIWDESTDPAWNSGRLPELDQYYAPDFQLHEPLPKMPAGLEGAKMSHGMAVAAYPDRRIHIEELLTAEDKVFLRTRVSGTEQGVALFWPGSPVSEPRPFSFESWSVYRMEGEKVAEQWGFDETRLALLQMRLQLLRALVEALPHSADAPNQSPAD